MKQKFCPQVNHLLDSYVHSSVILFEENCDKEQIRAKGLRSGLRSGTSSLMDHENMYPPWACGEPKSYPFYPL